MSSVIYPLGEQIVLVPAGSKIAISCKNGEAIVFYSTFPIGSPESYYEHTRVKNGETTLGAFSTDVHIKIEAKLEPVYYNVGTAPAVLGNDAPMTRSTVDDGATLTAAQHQGWIIYQDASLLSRTMTTLTGTELAEVFSDVAVGEAVPLYHASNAAINTSTLIAGVGVTLIGSGAVTATGGQYLMVRTGASTFDLVRVG